MQGVYPSYQAIENWQVQAGSLLTEQDEQQSSTVAVIGQTVLDNLFGNGNAGSGNAAAALARRFGSTMCRSRSKACSLQRATSKTTSCRSPFSVAHLRLNNQTYGNQIVVQVANASGMTAAQAQIQAVLEQQHRITNGRPPGCGLPRPRATPARALDGNRGLSPR